MESDAPLFWWITLSCSTLLIAVSASVAWLRGSASTRPRKPPPSPPATPISPSPSEIASLQTDQAALFSNLEKLTTTVKRLSSRQGMRETRARKESASAPPRGAPKAELLRHYGMSGKVGPQFAQAQLDLERQRGGERDEPDDDDGSWLN